MVMFIEDILFYLLLAKAFFTFLLPHNKGLPLTPSGLIPISLKAPWEHCLQDQCHCRCLDSLQQSGTRLFFQSLLLLTKVAEMANSHFTLLTDKSGTQTAAMMMRWGRFHPHRLAVRAGFTQSTPV